MANKVYPQNLKLRDQWNEMAKSETRQQKRRYKTKNGEDRR